jgi:DNA-binding MarR family transcriptional regulator
MPIDGVNLLVLKAVWEQHPDGIDTAKAKEIAEKINVDSADVIDSMTGGR